MREGLGRDAASHFTFSGFSHSIGIIWVAASCPLLPPGALSQLQRHPYNRNPALGGADSLLSFGLRMCQMRAVRECDSVHRLIATTDWTLSITASRHRDVRSGTAFNPRHGVRRRVWRISRRAPHEPTRSRMATLHTGLRVRLIALCPFHSNLRRPRDAVSNTSSEAQLRSIDRARGVANKGCPSPFHSKQFFKPSAVYTSVRPAIAPAIHTAYSTLTTLEPCTRNSHQC